MRLPSGLGPSPEAFLGLAQGYLWSPSNLGVQACWELVVGGRPLCSMWSLVRSRAAAVARTCRRV